MEWYPTPSYLVKRKVILDFLATIAVDRFLEVGCGAGDLLAALAERGYQGVGIDISPDALATASSRVHSPGVQIELKQPEEVAGTFDVVIASEVLEHCDDDVGMLKELRAKIRPGGYLVITVPAHMEKWGANDDLCGHLRRYERAELYRKFSLAGFESLCVYSYGVPVYNIMKPFYDRAVRNRVDHTEGVGERTRQSSGMRLAPRLGWLFRILFNDRAMAPFYLLQRLFFNTELGNGYFAVARHPGEEGTLP